MKTAILDRRVTIFDVKPPFRMSDNRFNIYTNELKQHHKFPLRYFITDSTPRGNFCTNDSKADFVRIEVDGRFITDEQVLETLNDIFETVYKQTRRFREYA